MALQLTALPWRVAAGEIGRRLLDGARWAAAAAFLLAGVAKLFDFESLRQAVLRLGWLPGEAVVPAGILLLAGELAVAGLLLSGRGVRAGAAGGAVLAALFTAVTLHLLLRGVRESCACFGLFLQLPGRVMLGVDLVLLGTCIQLARRPAHAAAPGAAASGSHAPSWLRRHLPALLLCYTVLMATALQAGFRRQEAIRGQAEDRQVSLRYGDRAPDFRLQSLAGGTVSPADYRGRWTLLSFVQAGCEPCRSELRALSERHAAWKSRVNLLVIVAGRPLLGDALQSTRAFASRLRLPMTVAVDPDWAVTNRYLDRPGRTPTSVLLDAEGTVRFIQDGFETGATSLVQDVDAILEDRPFTPESVHRAEALFGRRAPDGELWLDGRPVRLSSLWKKRPVLLSFLLKDCAGCKHHTMLVERVLGGSDDILPVHVYPSRREAAAAAATLPPGCLVASDDRGGVHMAYQAWNAPTAFLINKGRLLYASGERSGPLELERVLRSKATLLASRWSGGPGPDTKERRNAR